MSDGQGADVNPVTVPDLEVRFRSLTEPEKKTAEALLADAWEELQARVPALKARRQAQLVSDGLVVRVVAAMVVRVLRNPDALRSWVVDGDSFTRDQLVSSGLLFITPDEVELLSGIRRGGPAQHLSFSVPYP